MKGRITKRSVDALEHPVPGRVLWDDRLAGFGVKPNPNGRKAYLYQYRMGGRDTPTRTITLGYHGEGLTADQARQLASEIAWKRANGIDEQQERKAKTAGGSDLAFDNYVEFFADRYLARKWERRGAEAARLLRREAKPHFQATKISDIHKRDVTALLDKLEARPGIATNTAAAMRRMFNWAIERGDLESSPMDRIALPAKPPSRSRFLDDSEIAALWRATRAIDHPIMSLTRFLLLTGQRRDEASHIRMCEIDEDTMEWNLPATRTKNKKPHTVPLSNLAREEVFAMRNEGGYLFSVNGERPIQNWSYWKPRLSKLVDTEAGRLLAPWKVHDIRRTVATGMQRIGVATDVIEAFQNRATRTGVAEVYQRHDYAEEKAQAAALWDDHIRSIVGSRA
ncbi:tyrosine-type recombinase/integrase [Sphingomicrobium arenosum]|uniref:tyrosine-type recombinase/integrase n=1 Tax=Sphingomicrobium arenosum TaxID=2233861 RepID=UPI00223E90FB|nr:site-specific integrase [Sphingomicrobium arenosum]